MNKNIWKLLIWIALCVACAYVLASPFLSLAQATEENQQYLPLISVYKPLGAQIEGSVAITRSNAISFAVPGRPYQFPIRWAKIEATRNSYNWDADNIINDLNYIQRNADYLHSINAPIILGIKTTPAWARLQDGQWEDYACSPPAPEYYQDYAEFVIAAIDKVQPWGIEIYNEPDVGLDYIITQPGHENYYGCWVLDGTPYISSTYVLAGQRYGQFLNAIYPTIKNARPGVNIIAGALSGANKHEFLDGAVAGGMQTDLISMHRYLNTNWDLNMPLNDAYNLYDRYGKKILISETSVRNSPNDFRAYQAMLVTHFREQLLENNWQNKVSMVEWYTLSNNGWFNTDLVENNFKYPAYYAWLLPTYTPTPTGGPSLPYPGPEDSLQIELENNTMNDTEINPYPAP